LISKTKAVIFMIVGALMCLPMVYIVLTPSFDTFFPVMMALAGLPLFFIGLSGFTPDSARPSSSVDSDLARVRYVQETKMRSGR